MIRFRLPLAALLLGALCAAAPGAALAQAEGGSGFVAASVTVAYPPLTGAGVRPLQFGVVLPSAGAATVLPADARAGEWRLTGVRGRKSLDISFTLPAALAGPNGATLPLSFNGNFAALCEIDNDQQCETASVVAWNPVTTPTFRDTPERYRPGRPRYTYDHYSVYLGGIALPSPSQPAGSYTGTVTITIIAN
jgi:hypothetical protein